MKEYKELEILKINDNEFITTFISDNVEEEAHINAYNKSINDIVEEALDIWALELDELSLFTIKL